MSNEKEKYEQLAKEIMENYPEYSFCVTCVQYAYELGRFTFLDPETGKEYDVRTSQVAKALPKLREKMAEKKLFFDGLHSGAESFFDAGNWDSISTDAAVQMVIFKDVIYG